MRNALIGLAGGGMFLISSTAQAWEIIELPSYEIERTMPHSGGIDRYGGHCVGGNPGNNGPNSCPPGRYHYHHRGDHHGDEDDTDWGLILVVLGGLVLVGLVFKQEDYGYDEISEPADNFDLSFGLDPDNQVPTMTATWSF